MPYLFISYSTQNATIVDQIRRYLENSGIAVWIDNARLTPGTPSWEQAIRNAISEVDAVLLCASPDALQSPYVGGEITIAQKLNKPIYPAWVDGDDWTDCVPLGLIGTQYADLRGDKYQTELTKLVQAIYGEQTSIATLVIQPEQFTELRDEQTETKHNPLPDRSIFALVGGLAIVIGAALLLIGVIGDGGETDDEPPTNAVAQQDTPRLEGEGAGVRATEMPTSTRTSTITATSDLGIAAALTAWDASAQTNDDWTPIIEEFNFEMVVVSANTTINIRRNPGTQYSIIDTANQGDLFILQNIDTSNNWVEVKLSDGTPGWIYADLVEMSTIDGSVEMVLVPPGCFMMGSEDGSSEQPVHEICFEEPFWIDRYEVTNEQYGSASDITICRDDSSDPDQPRNCVDWFEARDFCVARGGVAGNVRLPTEAEWEYAARGPDSLVYPWGNEWNGDFVVWCDNSGGQTVPVGSRPEGASWAGALDLSGNLWEWTSSLYDQDAFPYPYVTDDGREADTAYRTNIRRVLRGGSWANSDSTVFRAAFRYFDIPDNWNNDDGFRCARSYE